MEASCKQIETRTPLECLRTTTLNFTHSSSSADRIGTYLDVSGADARR